MLQGLNLRVKGRTQPLLASVTDTLAHIHEELCDNTQHMSQQISRDVLLYTAHTGEVCCFKRQIFSSANNDVLPIQTECQ